VAQPLSSAAEHNSLSNSAARAELIRKAGKQLAEYDAQAKALNAEIREFKQKHIKGDLGFKIADWNAVYRVSQLEVEDRDALVETLREGFAALSIGQVVDWVDAAQATPSHRGNGVAAENKVARLLGHEDGLSGGHDHADEYPQGEPGHADYMLGLADGEAERERVMALGNGAEARKRRGRPRKQREAEADAEL
jgi:hypothetical protein